MSISRRAGRARLLATALGVSVAAFALPARAQVEGYAADYCEPPAGTKLLYTNRAYEIEPKSVDEPPLYYTYKILTPSGRSQHVDRLSQFMFDDGTDQWDVETQADQILGFWPLWPGKQLTIQRVDRQTGVTAEVTFTVLGLDPIRAGSRLHNSWKIRRIDNMSNGTHFYQFLWYAPGLCTLSAFTDSQHRLVRLLQVLEPGDRDYDRALKVKDHHLYFADNDEMVK
ncbi:MAG TPA: hypothetical protein VLX09_25485 [Stellaceae bacterium]|nr:hypothetical protein [Stellaceae bacterium]